MNKKLQFPTFLAFILAGCYCQARGVFQDSVPLTPNYYTETSRSETQINKIFPFDIDLKTAGEKTINSAQLLKNPGKPTVLVFWLTTCYPCRLELEALKQNMTAWKKETDFQLFTISTDFPDRKAAFVETVNAQNWPFEAYHDFNREFRYVIPGELNGLPQLFVFNKKGVITYSHRRYTPGDEKELFEQIKKATAE